MSTREFQKGCRDHVRSKNGRHRFWETVERVDEIPTSPSQHDLESLAAGGQILETLFRKYVESWNGYENINDHEKEKEGVIIKFEKARRVLQRWNIAIRPLSERATGNTQTTAVERLTAEVQTQTDPPGEATHDWVTDGPPQPHGAQTLAV